MGQLKLWSCVASGMALVVWGVIKQFPSERSRWIFRRRPGALMFWLRGEHSLPATLLTGGPVVAGVAWWFSTAGWPVPDAWRPVLLALWSGASGVALLNAARKKRLCGVACAAVAVLITLLWMVMAVYLRQAAGGVFLNLPSG